MGRKRGSTMGWAGGGRGRGGVSRNGSVMSALGVGGGKENVQGEGEGDGERDGEGDGEGDGERDGVEDADAVEDGGVDGGVDAGGKRHQVDEGWSRGW